MTDSEDVKMEIIIAGEQIMLTVPYSRQEAVRSTESSVNKLFNDWRIRFPRKNPKELLAMIAYQYASFYDELRERYATVSMQAQEIDRKLSELLGEGHKEV